VRFQWDQLESFIGRWTWGDQVNDPRLLSALVGATWIQDLWKYRPQVSLRGESDAGKSKFCELLFGNSTGPDRGVFGNLAVRISSSTAAGIRQTVGNTSFVICMDEFDSLSHKERAAVLKLLRTAGPGDTITMGTSHHTAIRFGMRAMCWMSGVIVGLDEQMDKNRFIQFDMLFPPEDRAVAWRYPTDQEIRSCNVGTLAIALAYGLEASTVAAGLRQRFRNAKIPKRLVEGVAGAASLVALSASGNVEAVMATLESFVTAITPHAMSEGHEKIHDEVLDQIAGLTINLPGQMQVTVATILDDDADYCDSREEIRNQLEAQLGIGKKKIGSDTFLVVHPGSVAKKLERGKSEVSQLLRRVCPGTITKLAKLAKAARHSVWIPWGYVKSRNAAANQEETVEELRF
jgi:hypothetical protein